MRYLTPLFTLLLLANCTAHSRIAVKSTLLSPKATVELAETLNNLSDFGPRRFCNVGRFSNEVEIDIDVQGGTRVEIDRRCQIGVPNRQPEQVQSPSRPPNTPRRHEQRQPESTSAPAEPPSEWLGM